MDFTVLTPHIIPMQWGLWFRILVTFQGPLTSCGFHSPFIPPGIHIPGLDSNVCGGRHWRQECGAREVAMATSMTHRSTCERPLHGALLEEKRKEEKKCLCISALFYFLLIKINPRPTLSPLPILLIASLGYAGSCLGSKTPPNRVWSFIQVSVVGGARASGSSSESIGMSIDSC